MVTILIVLLVLALVGALPREPLNNLCHYGGTVSKGKKSGLLLHSRRFSAPPTRPFGPSERGWKTLRRCCHQLLANHE